MRKFLSAALLGWIVSCGGTVDVRRANQNSLPDAGSSPMGTGGAPANSVGGASGAVGAGGETTTPHGAGGAAPHPTPSGAGGTQPIPLGDASVASDSGIGNPRECQVTVSGEYTSPSTYVFTYDPVARRLVTDVYTIDLDDAERTWKVYGNEPNGPVLYWTTLYDDLGNPISEEHYTLGLRSYANTYNGTLLQRVDAWGGGLPSWLTLYRYEDPAAPTIWTREETNQADGGIGSYSLDRTIVDGKLSTLTSRNATGQAVKKWTYFYDGDRIATVERDGGYWESDVPDGTPDIRWRWERSSDGQVVRYSQDGTDSTDNPYIDGKADVAETFSPGCKALLDRFPWVAHEPGPFSVGPRRLDRT